MHPITEKDCRGSDGRVDRFISVISWRLVLLVEETEVPRENHRHIPRH